MNEEIELLTIAALLHDIGKFAQRAGCKKSESLEGEFCPTSKKTGRPTHTHVLYSDYFIENELHLPSALVNKKSKIARMASSHHKPAQDSLLELALHRGDCLSAGTDRIKDDLDTGDYKSARLVSVFDQVSLRSSKEVTDADQFHYYKLKPIDVDSFPTSLNDASQTSYEALFENFLNDMRQIRIDMGVKHYISSLISLLEKYTWCIPSSTYHTLPDISLYDHALTTAAIAQSLSVYHGEEGGLPGERSMHTKKFILFGGDLSGIQKYIFSIDKSHGSGVAKLFRARSFYLQVITKSVILSLLDRLKLLPVAKIMDAGGRFILLLPATSTVRNLLPKFEKEIQQWLLEKFRGELSLSYSHAVELAEDDLNLSRFQKKHDELNDHLEQRKLARFDRVLEDRDDPFLSLNYNEAEGGNCKVCRVNAVDATSTEVYKAESGNEVPICTSCREQISLIGKKLPNEAWKYLILSRTEKEGNSIQLFDGIWMQFEKTTGVDASDALEITNIRDRSGFAYHPIAGHLPMIRHEDMVRWKDDGLVEIRGGETFYNGEVVKEGMPKTFNILAGESRKVLTTDDGKKEAKGKSFIAALKVDVDYLGFIFSIGLQERLSISRFAGMSRMLNHFFASYLTSSIRENFNDIYIVFAGGDDLFLLGPWTKMVEFASLTQNEFRRFVANNPEVTISAGIAVSKPGLPMHTIQAEAEHLLKRSKHEKSDKGDAVKNSVTLFDTTVNWPDFEKLRKTGEWIEQLVVEEKITSGLARRLLTYSDDFIAFRKRGEIKRGIYLSHMAYDFKRNVDEEKLDAEERNKFYSIKTDEFLLEHMRLPLSYALYKIRKD